MFKGRVPSIHHATDATWSKWVALITQQAQIGNLSRPGILEVIMDWPEGKDFGISPEEEVTRAEEAPLYNKLPENEKQYALFTDGSCRIVGKHQRWKAAVWSRIRQVVETAEGDGESSQFAESAAILLRILWSGDRRFSLRIPWCQLEVLQSLRSVEIQKQRPIWVAKTVTEISNEASMNHTTVVEFVLLGLTNSRHLEIILFLFLVIAYFLILLGNITVISITLRPHLQARCYENLAMYTCGGLTLSGCQTPAKQLSHCPSSTGQQEKTRLKSSWIEIKMGRSLTNYHHRCCQSVAQGMC
ncbi:hypothetical protein QYF61_009829 [Mycteria americana]|uniref:Uncharacterized protein n=1 Tax=Mycteria americana TaxID=33587 RepID=A0AAN7MPF3_MYCAM|nr:hypothetical protein QYF61_009829 [Mycteria americana]